MTVDSEKTILINICGSEITHAIHLAEKTAVPFSKICHGTECVTGRIILISWPHVIQQNSGYNYGQIVGSRAPEYSTLFVFTRNLNFPKPSHSIRLTKLPVPARLPIIGLLLYGVSELRKNLPVAHPEC